MIEEPELKKVNDKFLGRIEYLPYIFVNEAHLCVVLSSDVRNYMSPSYDNYRNNCVCHSLASKNTQSLYKMTLAFLLFHNEKFKKVAYLTFSETNMKYWEAIWDLH